VSSKSTQSQFYAVGSTEHQTDVTCNFIRVARRYDKVHVQAKKIILTLKVGFSTFKTVIFLVHIFQEMLPTLIYMLKISITHTSIEDSHYAYC
jgi:hypothetical protein